MSTDGGTSEAWTRRDSPPGYAPPAIQVRRRGKDETTAIGPKILRSARYQAPPGFPLRCRSSLQRHTLCSNRLHGSFRRVPGDSRSVLPPRPSPRLILVDKLCRMSVELVEWPNFLESIAQRHVGMHGGFCLLANVQNIAFNEPFEVTPGVLIRPARDDEALTFGELLALTRISSTPFLHHRNPYETRVEKEVLAPNHFRTYIRDLPAGEHRYCVAEFSGANVTLHHVLEASALTAREVEMGITVHIGGSFGFGLSWTPFQQRILEDARSNDEPLLTLELHHLEDWRRVFDKFQRHRDEGIGLLPALQQFRELHAIPPSSPLRFLGYVAILESLVTHQPDPKDHYDSLTRQVTQKMLLLGRRCQLTLPFDRFGPDCKPETLWKKLYAHRSAVAHGVPIDFNGKFQMLGNASQALAFIRDSTVAVMRHALGEPELVSDLRAC